MIHHLSEDLLARFVDGTLDEKVAIAAAEHIDSCSQCSVRAAVAEPLAQAFASVQDPLPPPGLVEDIMLAVEAGNGFRRAPSQEVVAAGSLLVGAGGLLVMGGAPAGLAAEAAIATKALLTGLGVLVSQLQFVPGWWSAAMAATGLGCCVLLVRRMGGWSRENL